MLNIELLMGVMSIGLIFVLIVTKAYKRSITTTVYVISLAISMQLYHTCDKDLSFVVITLGAIFSLMRAVFNHKTDQLVKR